jgi:agmatine deiminase
MEKKVGSFLREGQVSFHHIRTVDVWVRDYGPTYLRGDGLALVKWKFNSWGMKYQDMLADDDTGFLIAKSEGLPVFSPGIVLEGGSIDPDGEGNILTTEQCLLNSNRNPGLGKTQLESFLGEYVSANRIIWLKRGIEGDDTDGHVDDVARFVGGRQVLAAIEPNGSDSNHGVLKENLKILESTLDQSGRSLEVQTMPMPPRIESPFGRLPASHMNFYVGNSAVLVPTFGGASDKSALRVLNDLFPDREAIGIDCRALLHGLGTLHCVTQQVPAA